MTDKGLLFSLGVFATLTSLVCLYILHRKQNNREEHYKETISTPYRLKEIIIYPIKSCGGISCERQQVNSCGLSFDRHWILYKEGNMLTMRTFPQMVLIQPSLDPHFLTLNAPNMLPCKIPLETSPSSSSLSPHFVVDVTVWNDYCKGIDEGDQVSQWLSEFLKSDGIRLLRQSQLYRRSISSQEDRVEGGKNVISFTDSSPFLIVSQASLDELNLRIQNSNPKEDTMSMARFRPNLVVEGPAFIEDHWKRISIGEIQFQLTSPCERCKATTVDPLSGQFSGIEPLATLQTFRKGQSKKNKTKVYFGQNASHLNEGTIKVGDRIRLPA